MPARRITYREYLQLIGLSLLPLLIILIGLNGFPYPSPEAEYSDLIISHYPNALYLRRALVEYRALPLWSPTILSGFPFFANPLSGLWYPPGWLALVMPLPLGFNVLIVLHMIWGGLGMYRLLRKQRLGHMAGLIGALAFLSMPKIFAQYGAGHLTLVYAVSWTPWLLLGGGRKYRSGVVLALIFLADPRWAPFAGLLWAAYVFAYRQNCASSPSSQVHHSTSNFQPKIQYLLSHTLLAALLASPLALPLLEYSRLSTRSAMGVEDIFAHSLPPARLLGLLYPDFGGHHEWMLYLGGVVLALVVVAVLTNRPKKMTIFWVGVFSFSVIFSLGSNLPPLIFLANIPGMDLLRVPPRALFLTGFSGAVLAAQGMECLYENPGRKIRKRISLLLVAVSFFSLFLALGVGILTGGWSLNFLWGAGIFGVTVLWILIWPQTRLPRQTWFAGLLLMSLLDWSFVNASLISFRSSQTVLTQGEQVSGFMRADDEFFRVYSPSYSVPQHSAARLGLELADGVDPLQIETYAEFMETASGVPRAGYSVTLPPFLGGDPKTSNKDFLPDARRLGLLNVAFVVADFDINVDGLVFLGYDEDRRIYSNEYKLPRAWVQPLADEIVSEVSSVSSLDWKPNKIVVSANGPGRLVLSEVDYPGWHATIDGEPAAMETFQGILRSVQLEHGRHAVEFVFRPKSLYSGLLLCLLGMLWLVWDMRNGRR